MNKPILEICAGSLASAIAAQEGGAFRVELCDNLYEGGTTPSIGAIELARMKLTIKLHVIIRPRGGDFLYSDLEYAIIRRDVERCRTSGVDGIVIGFLTPDGRVDVARTDEIVNLARPMAVTFHRAFDMSRDPFEALEDLKMTGVDRLLTSGQKNLAPEGAGLIASLIRQSEGKIIILPGGGLNEQNIREFAKQVNATEYHATLRRKVESGMIFHRDDVFMGGLSAIPEFSILETDPSRVAAMVTTLNNMLIG
ncbi:MAG: copper homeostasis protein CutC [Bacteroidia bacterium]|nr:copper homeostasis protein CutC [Bacteroidia bacterium]